VRLHQLRRRAAGVYATRAAAFPVAPRAACAAHKSRAAMGDGAIQLNSWQSVENLILRPPRSDMYTRDDLLGGPDGEFAVVGVDGASIACFRMDVEARSHSEALRNPEPPCQVAAVRLLRGLMRAPRSAPAYCAARS